jgi:hypothetical protein
MEIKKIFLPLKIVLLSLSCSLILSCISNSVKKGMLIIMEAPVSNQPPEKASGVTGHNIPGERISAILPGKPGSLKVLTKDFYSACSPAISYDGRLMLFAAQQKQDEPWQIWEMNLDNLKCRKITSFKENCTDPAYLPVGRMVFSKMTVNDTVKSAHCLYVCNMNGSGLKQITYSPSDNLSTIVLKDGRLLTINSQLLPEKGEPILMILRPDGTKADMFYKGAGGKTLIGAAHETSDGKILFIESDKEGLQKGDLISITYNRPLHSRIELTSSNDGDFCSVLPVASDRYLVSCRKSVGELFSLYEFDPEKKLLGQKVFSDPGYDVTDAILVEEYERPKKLPSEVDLQVKTGLLLCQDLNFGGFQLTDNISDNKKALKIEILGVDTTYGVVKAEKDGSFQLKVMADIPFRIRTLDGDGNVTNGPCSWIWLRPNERRGCIGCHEDPELVPENKVSMAIKKSPVIIPVHITKVKEKIVDLE